MSQQAVHPSTAAEPERARVVLVTGLSGAGKTTALQALEDLGYEAVDNLPLSLLGGLLPPGATVAGEGPPNNVAVSIDSRTRDFGADAFERAFKLLESRDDLDVRLLFIDCDDEVLQRRFTETRRRHPMAVDRPVRDGIEHERKLVARLRYQASVVIDTSRLSNADLRRLIGGHFRIEGEPGLALAVTSFSYRRGLPREADLVFDVRFLANPHYRDELRPKTGREPEVGAFIAGDPAFAPFFSSVTALVLSLLPHFAREGKSYLTIAIGCTGGRHRSVYIADRLAQLLRDEGHPVNLRHRDMDAPATH
jgi:UPF0042 nucleotide-binding protein